MTERPADDGTISWSANENSLGQQARLSWTFQEAPLRGTRLDASVPGNPKRGGQVAEVTENSVKLAGANHLSKAGIPQAPKGVCA